jgi:GT2 family glycosyltransferase
MAKVSVIIVNYNGQHLLGALLESLARQTRPADEVLLVDNASSDGSAQFVRETFPWVTVKALLTNTGFAEGNNIGFAQAQGEYVALLNSDTVVGEQWLAELERMLDRDERIGAAVAKIFLDAAHTRIAQVGAEFNNLCNVWGRGFNQPDHGQFEEPTEVPALTACSAMIRRRALEGEPLFDRSFFMYHEELDLSLRLRGRGYTIVYVPTAVVYHKWMQSVKQVSPQPFLYQQLYFNRKRSKILAKYYPLSLLLRSSPLILLSFIYWDTFFLRHGGPGLFLRAVLSQMRFALQGLKERLRGHSVPAEKWLPWMTNQGLREILLVRAAVSQLDNPPGMVFRAPDHDVRKSS